MSLLTCPDCNKKVSDTASACPKCGFKLTPEIISAILLRHQRKTRLGQEERDTKTGYAMVGIALFCAPIILESKWCKDNSISPARERTAYERPETLFVIKGEGCILKNIAKRVKEYFDMGDYTASAKLSTDSGLCIIFRNDEVYVIETDRWSGLVKVRPVGEPIEYWMIQELSEIK